MFGPLLPKSRDGGHPQPHLKNPLWNKLELNKYHNSHPISPALEEKSMLIQEQFLLFLHFPTLC